MPGPPRGFHRHEERALRQEHEFAEFYQANYGKITAVVAAVLGDRREAEDVTQEAFARALVRWPRLVRYELPEAWVRRVALRLAVDHSRRLRRTARLAVKLLGTRKHGRPGRRFLPAALHRHPGDLGAGGPERR
jgi:DNA-directed RNA polymerase specialized sigma24 family protein